MHNEPLVILLAENDDGHASLVERNLKRAGIVNVIQRFKDGQEILDFLQENTQKSSPIAPQLLLLDLNMPRVDGVEVLRRIKANEATATIPVVMLTTTDDPREVERCYTLGCGIYITKPVGYEPFVEAMRRLGLFLQVVKVPRRATSVEKVGTC